MKKVLSVILALLLLLSLAACGGSKEKAPAANSGNSAPVVDNNGVYEFRGYTLDGDITTDPVATVASPLDVKQVYANLEYVPQMFYGDYRSTVDWQLTDAEAKDHLAKYDTMTFTINDTEWTTSVVPYRYECGPNTFNNVVQYDTGHHWIKLYFLTEDGGMKYVVCRYEVEGNTFRALPLTKWNYDDTNKTLTYQLSDLVWEYTFSFSGPHLTLSQGSNSITLTAEKFLNKEYFCQGGEYLAPGSATFENVDTVRIVSTRINVESTNKEDRYHSAVGALTEDGLLTLSWKNHEGKQYVRQLVYFLCGFDGIVLADMDGYYLYTAGYFDRYADSLNGSISVEEKSALENMDEEQIQQIIEKRENLLVDLAAAYQDAGLNVTVNEETGEIVMDSSVLFAVDSADVSAEGQSFLMQFITVYTSVVFNEKYNGFVSTIMVEGHTDTSGDYDYNLELSQKRADSVKNYCVSVDNEYGSILEDMMVAAGYSFTNPIYTEDGQVDMDASRRVAFRFLINLTA
ncbi:MAG: OmpA family protein [Oscillospiraceae bacterium]|nr:OmpA family protein [Oscillospiraceae bacterium]